MFNLEVGLDFDGVFANSHPVKALVAKEKFGVDIDPEFFRRENIIPLGILNEEQYKELGAISMGGTYPIPPVEGLLEHLPVLMQIHMVRVVTSRSGGMLVAAQDWLKGHSLELPIRGVGYRVSKVDACKGLDVYVDDDLDKLVPMIGIVPNLFFFSWPWNKHEVAPNDIKRVWSWVELMESIHQIKK